MTGKIPSEALIEDVFIMHALENFRGALTIEYRVSERDFDALWMRTRAVVEIDEQCVPSMALPAGRHEIMVIADSSVAVGEFSCDGGAKA